MKLFNRFSSRSRRVLLGLMTVVATASWHFSSAESWAETWSDNTGNFKVDAQFVAIQGDKVVLKKANGVTIQVPLARLDKSSQELAKKLAGAPAAPTTSTPAATPAKSAGNQTADAYLRELFAASDAGDYQKIWAALPSNYQNDIHDVIHLFAENMDPTLWNQVTGVLKKAVKLLKDKKQFIIGHPQVALAAPVLAKNLPALTEALDATINSELTNLEKLKKFDVVKFAAGDGKKIAEKMKAAGEAVKELQKFAPVPPGAGPGGAEGANPFAGLADVKATDVKIIVVKQDANSAVLKFEVKGKSGPEDEWVKIDGKWLPKKMVDEWEPKMAKAKQFISTEMKQALEGAKVQVGFMLAPVNATIDSLQAAQTQEQFNQVITTLQQQFGGASPGAVPGAVPGR